MALLSGMRVIARKAFGAEPMLAYDKETTDQLRARARRVRPTEPRYTRPVDFGGDGRVWMSIVRARRQVEGRRDTDRQRLHTLRDIAIFLERHDAARQNCNLSRFRKLEDAKA